MDQTTEQRFGLPLSFYAQPVQADKGLLINGQNLIDAFSECTQEQCDKLAALLAQGSHDMFGRLMEKILLDWADCQQ